MDIRDLILSFTAPLILLGLGAVLFRRRLYREFPLFFAYILYVPFADLLRISVASRPTPYYWLYWITEGIYGAAEVSVITEVFRWLFILEFESLRWFRALLPVTIFLIFGFSLWQTVYHPLGRGIPWEVNAIYWFDFGVHLLEVAILVLLVVLRTVLPVRWRPHEFGILIGFGVAASFTLFAYLMRFEWGSRYELFFRYGPPAGYILATLVWLDAFLRPPEPRPRTERNAEEMLGTMRWYNALMKKIKRFMGMRKMAVQCSNAMGSAARRGECG
jgi:hypothetical protein